MTEADTVIVHELAPLVGTWRGSGRGHFPTIDDFDYEEEFVVTATRKPVVATSQRTWGARGPMHMETGWLRWCGEGGVEWVIAQPTGLAEVSPGTFVDGVVAVAGPVHGTPTAVDVLQVRREYRFSPDQLDYDLWMATEVVPSLTHHLSARLMRVSASK